MTPGYIQKPNNGYLELGTLNDLLTSGNIKCNYSQHLDVTNMTHVETKAKAHQKTYLCNNNYINSFSDSQPMFFL